MAKQIEIVSEICLYGNGASKAGTGWLATVKGNPEPFGTGELKLGRGWTEAVFEAAEAINARFRAAGMEVSGAGVRIFEAGGRRMADVELDEIPYYGQLKWKEDVVVYTIDVEEIMRVSAEQTAAMRATA